MEVEKRCFNGVVVSQWEQYICLKFFRNLFNSLLLFGKFGMNDVVPVKCANLKLGRFFYQFLNSEVARFGAYIAE